MISAPSCRATLPHAWAKALPAARNTINNTAIPAYTFFILPPSVAKVYSFLLATNLVIL
jgi:hypothetical protein